MFETIPTYDRYRTLKLTSPNMRGEDVFALQTALNAMGYPCGEADGIFGPATDKAVRLAQTAALLVVDGLAGGDTQKQLALGIATRVAREKAVWYSCFIGQIEHESGYRLGNYSPPRADGTYDAGVVQRNTKYTVPQIGFDVPLSISALGADIRRHYDLFAGLPTRRRWALAQGAWNAPAFACYIARQEGAFKVTTSMTLRPGTTARAAFDAYVEKVSKYLPV